MGIEDNFGQILIQEYEVWIKWGGGGGMVFFR